MNRRTRVGKGLIRSQSRRGVQSRKRHPAEMHGGRLGEPTVCDRCGDVLVGRVWHRPTRMARALLEDAAWVVCPACTQVRAGTWVGRILVRGTWVTANERAIRSRVRNVVARAAWTQPQRRLVALEADARGLEILTTSQKLAHRIVHELKKAFGGRTSYAWSDDGSLFATWRRSDAAGARR